MIQPLYKKGNRLAWIGFIIAFASLILQALATGANGFLQVSSLAPFAIIFSLLALCGLVLITWGCVFALQAKNRSYWWMLLLVPGLFGAGIIFAAIIFMLPDKSPTNSTPTRNSQVPPAAQD